MTEVTHTIESLANLQRANGRGLKIWAGYITVDDGETLNTGLDYIYGCAFTAVEATAVDADSNMAWVKSITAGTITFTVNDVGDYTDGSSAIVYGIVVGRVN